MVCMHLWAVILSVLVQVMENEHVKKNKTYEEAFCWLVRPWDVSAELFQKLQEITSRMYIVPLLMPPV